MSIFASLWRLLGRPLRIAVLPSNQPVPEQLWAVACAHAAVDEFGRQGHIARMFWTPGAGLKSTDELGVMLRDSVAWKPDLVLSLHSDWAGGVKDIFPQIRSEAERPWGDAVGKPLAARLGMPFQRCAIRGGDLMFYYSNGMPRMRALLLEIGRYNVAADALFNVHFAVFEGIMATRCFLLGTGVSLKSDGPVPVGVAVPPGQEKYKPLPAPVPVPASIPIPISQPQEAPEMNAVETALLQHADNSAAQLTYDARIANRLLMKDYAGAVALSAAFYTRWPKESGSLPKGITAEALKAKAGG